jgi:hypothetical protein
MLDVGASLPRFNVAHKYVASKVVHDSHLINVTVIIINNISKIQDHLLEHHALIDKRLSSVINLSSKFKSKSFHENYATRLTELITI